MLTLSGVLGERGMSIGAIVDERHEFGISFASGIEGLGACDGVDGCRSNCFCTSVPKDGLKFGITIIYLGGSPSRVVMG